MAEPATLPNLLSADAELPQALQEMLASLPPELREDTLAAIQGGLVSQEKKDKRAERAKEAGKAARDKAIAHRTRAEAHMRDLKMKARARSQASGRLLVEDVLAPFFCHWLLQERINAGDAQAHNGLLAIFRTSKGEKSGGPHATMRERPVQVTKSKSKKSQAEPTGRVTGGEITLRNLPVKDVTLHFNSERDLQEQAGRLSTDVLPLLLQALLQRRGIEDLDGSIVEQLVTQLELWIEYKVKAELASEEDAEQGDAEQGELPSVVVHADDDDSEEASSQSLEVATS